MEVGRAGHRWLRDTEMKQAGHQSGMQGDRTDVRASKIQQGPQQAGVKAETRHKRPPDSKSKFPKPPLAHEASFEKNPWLVLQLSLCPCLLPKPAC